MKFDLDFKTFIIRFEAPDIRKPIQVSWLYALLKPIEILHGVFIAYREKLLREISYTSETIVLEYLLNERFPNTGNLIYIDNSFDNIDRIYEYYLNEFQEPRYEYFLDEVVDPAFLTYLEENLTSHDFIIYVPNTLVINETLLRATVNKYKVTSIRYIVKYYAI